MKNELVRHQAFELRKQNKSYSYISRELSVPKSTLSGWFKNITWSHEIRAALSAMNSESQKAKLRLMANSNRLRFELIRSRARDQARLKFTELSKSKLFIASLMIYSGEGDSKIDNSIVRVANTDPRMVKIFIKFLREICEISPDKIKLALVLYPDLKVSECVSYWSSLTEIDKKQFYKSQVIRGKHPTNRLKNGICYVIVCSRELKEKILVWIDLCYKSL